MDNFDPDQYLASKTPFNPDTYLANKGVGEKPAVDLEPGVMGQTDPGNIHAITDSLSSGMALGSLPELGMGAASLLKLGKAAPKIVEEAPKMAEEASKVAGKVASDIPLNNEIPTKDPLKDIKDFVNSHYEKKASEPGFAKTASDYLKRTSQNLGVKDLGMQPRQIQSMGPGLEGPEKARALAQYAREQGYFEPTLTDMGREKMLLANKEKAGQAVEAVRSLADQRGTSYDMPSLIQQVKQELDPKYLKGVTAAPKEYARALQTLTKSEPTASGLAETATKLNKATTDIKKMSQSPGPATDIANIISRYNNESIKKVLNPEELKTYEDNLRNYGAHAKLEQILGKAGSREAGSRSNQRGLTGRLFQEVLDRGGYRIGGNLANKMSDAISKNPNIVKSLPSFFEEFAHNVGDIPEEMGFADGGVIPYAQNTLPADVIDWIKRKQI